MLIRKALERHDGNVSQAAKALGLSRSALYRRLAASWHLTGGAGAGRSRVAGLHRGAARRGCPPSLLAGWLLWTGDHPLRGPADARRSLVGGRLAHRRAARARARASGRCRRISNLLAALREGDYSIRARGADADDGAGPRAARGQHARARRCARSACGPSRRRRCCARVMEEIDVAIFAFDGGTGCGW